MTRKEYICVGAYVFSGLRPSRDELRDAMKLKLSGGRTHTRIVLLCNTVTTLGFGRVSRCGSSAGRDRRQATKIWMAGTDQDSRHRERSNIIFPRAYIVVKKRFTLSGTILDFLYFDIFESRYRISLPLSRVSTWD